MATTPSEATYQRLLSALESRIHKSRLITDDVRRLAYGTDASFYRLIPKLVVQAESLDEVIYIITTCGELLVPFTFRAAGTSFPARQSQILC